MRAGGSDFVCVCSCVCVCGALCVFVCIVALEIVHVQDWVGGSLSVYVCSGVVCVRLCPQVSLGHGHGCGWLWAWVCFSGVLCIFFCLYVDVCEHLGEAHGCVNLNLYTFECESVYTFKCVSMCIGTCEHVWGSVSCEEACCV